MSWVNTRVGDQPAMVQRLLYLKDKNDYIEFVLLDSRVFAINININEACPQKGTVMSGTVYGSRIIADVTLRSLSPYSQSRAHDEPAYENESKADYDRRTWRSHLHVQNGTVRIPAKAIHDCLIEAAQYSGKKISGNRTWTSKFESGIALFDNPDLGVRPEEVDYIDCFCHANGKRGSAARVMRRFPIINSWQTRFEIHVLDPIITEAIFREMIGIAGTFKGIGRYRPANRGTNGRFELADLNWVENRQLVA